MTTTRFRLPPVAFSLSLIIIIFFLPGTRSGDHGSLKLGDLPASARPPPPVHR